MCREEWQQYREGFRQTQESKAIHKTGRYTSSIPEAERAGFYEVQGFKAMMSSISHMWGFTTGLSRQSFKQVSGWCSCYFLILPSYSLMLSKTTRNMRNIHTKNLAQYSSTKVRQHLSRGLIYFVPTLSLEPLPAYLANRAEMK